MFTSRRTVAVARAHRDKNVKTAKKSSIIVMISIRIRPLQTSVLRSFANRIKRRSTAFRTLVSVIGLREMCANVVRRSSVIDLRLALLQCGTGYLVVSARNVNKLHCNARVMPHARRSCSNNNTVK